MLEFSLGGLLGLKSGGLDAWAWGEPRERGTARGRGGALSHRWPGSLALTLLHGATHFHKEV